MGLLYWSILLLAVSLIFMAMELFLPSGGVLGFLSAISCIGAVVLAFQGGPTAGVSILLAAAVIVPLALAAAVRIWPHTPFGRLVIQRKPTMEEVLPQRRDLKPLIGEYGVATTKMLPGGVVRVGDESFDAISRSEPLDPGEPIQVVDVDTNRLVVRRAPLPASRDESAGDTLPEPLRNLEFGSLDDPT